MILAGGIIIQYIFSVISFSHRCRMMKSSVYKLPLFCQDCSSSMMKMHLIINRRCILYFLLFAIDAFILCYEIKLRL